MRIQILGYRVAGLDGVTLECENWKNVLTRMGHEVTFVAGDLDREGILLPGLHFKTPIIAKIHDQVAYNNTDYKKVERRIFEQAGKLEAKLRVHFRQYGTPDLLILPNVLSLPMHFPLAVSLTRVIEEMQIPTIARHHDFWWERDRYNKSHMFSFWQRWFPPQLPNLWHTVINSPARDELKKRTGIDAQIISDSFDFTQKYPKKDKYCEHFREDFGLANDDFVFLQATRVIPRKRIELAIELIAKLNNPKAVLVIAGHEGDEQYGYMDSLKKKAKDFSARCLFIGNRVRSRREYSGKRRYYTLWDCYLNADAVTYPTEIEGFGNQFVEAVFFKKPVIITPYPVYTADIKPLGFKAIEMSESIDQKTLDVVQELIENPSSFKMITEQNFELGKKYMSYEWVEGKLEKLFKQMELK